MKSDRRLELVGRGTQEIVTEAELRDLLEPRSRPKAYVGLEPSGLLHVGQGLILSDKVKDFLEADIDFTILLADWHAYINDKLGGSLENIKTAARYLQDCFSAMGLPTGRVRYVMASDLVASPDYWSQVLRVSKAASLARIKRALTIMGRREGEAEIDASKLIYPAMQVADIHALDLDLAYAGMDQRHAHMLYRDLSPKLGWKKVVAVHSPLLVGLGGGGKMDASETKMSKSKPEGAIFVHDAPEAIQRKLVQAFCPAREAEGNPVLQLWELILFRHFETLRIRRQAKHGGDVEYRNYGELRTAFTRGDLHPLDLKAATARYLADLLAPVREFFDRQPESLQAVEAMVRRGAPSRA